MAAIHKETKALHDLQAEDPLTAYRYRHTIKLSPCEKELNQATLNHPRSLMLGGLEVMQFNKNIIQLIKAKKALDIGTFTGFSALCAAIALPEDGQVITMDISDEDYKQYGEAIISKSGVAHKIILKVQPGLKTLDELIANEGANSYDFAFIDAVKQEYPEYYQKCMQLIRPGGVIAIDNSFAFGGGVVSRLEDPEVAAIDRTNKMVFADERVNCMLLPIDDGLMVAFKK